MAFLTFIGKWPKRLLAKFRCSLNGHSDVVVLEELNNVIFIGDFKDLTEEELRTRRNNKVQHYQARCVCNACGERFVGTFAVAEL
jgi:hypothetical protein